MKNLLILLALISLINTVYSQKTIAEWASQEDKAFNKNLTYLNNLNQLKTALGRGWVSADAIQFPKKIGILSYSMVQPTFTEKDSYSIYTNYLTDTGVGNVLDYLFPKTIEGISSAASQHGLTFLTPEQYCDTPEKKAKYESTEFELSKLFKGVDIIQTRLRSYQGTDDAKGWVGKFIVAANADIKVWRSVAAFAKEMGVDALLVVGQTVYLNGTIVGLGPANITLIGVNPTPPTSETNWAPVGPLKGYLEGFIYGSVDIASPPLVLATIKKKNITFSDNAGLETAFNRAAGNMFNYAKTELDKIKK